jgi:hypothetical protein
VPAPHRETLARSIPDQAGKDGVPEGNVKNVKIVKIVKIVKSATRWLPRSRREVSRVCDGTPAADSLVTPSFDPAPSFL